MKKTLLIVDDDMALNDLLAAYFEHDYRILQAYDGKAGLELFNDADLLILDVMMPELDGVSVLRHIRQISNVPVLMLTAKAEDMDKITGLESGADDYVAKPCHPRELKARLANLLGRNQTPESLEEVDVPVDLDMVRRQIKVDGDVLALTDLEFEIMSRLYDDVLSVVSKDTLFESVFKRTLQPFDRTLDVHVSNIRKKLKGHSMMIQTVRGKGFRLCPKGDA